MIENYVNIKVAARELHKTQKEIREEIVKKFGKNIKTTCCSCGNKIKYSVARYYAMGNMCNNCNATVGHFIIARVLHKGIIKSNKKAEENLVKLTAHMKKYRIKKEDMFASLNFNKSFQDYLAESKRIRP